MLVFYPKGTWTSSVHTVDIKHMTKFHSINTGWHWCPVGTHWLGPVSFVMVSLLSLIYWEETFTGNNDSACHRMSSVFPLVPMAVTKGSKWKDRQRTAGQESLSDLGNQEIIVRDYMISLFQKTLGLLRENVKGVVSSVRNKRAKVTRHSKQSKEVCLPRPKGSDTHTRPLKWNCEFNSCKLGYSQIIDEIPWCKCISFNLLNETHSSLVPSYLISTR